MTSPSPTAPPARPDGPLPLRERKKLRTRRALAEAALALFSERGYDATTLDDVVDAVEVSKRTFFRNYACKEDVALAPELELWAHYRTAVRDRPLTGSLLTFYQETLFETLADMSDDWERHFLTSRKLAESTPALTAHSLENCSRTTEAVIDAVIERLGPGHPDPIRLRLPLEVVIAAWRWALHRWSSRPGEPAREDLVAEMRQAFAAIGDSMRLTLDDA
ncbi:TetR/AcrR family transcriptional regulator [Allostreptomyces psammosilenae]|uniref:AcrR family transcriptional regulator n=1 Tax=Allostreptomyces psammosilenae TaxID=1892865 RepID=A0A853A004_9ACTN|nr:TetR/AcrR family transcriptional regulator [Allostreptomyces psammosilenae]NYI07437.1 AcrR family transcriptional regulator [Allostreptomyces psammosilenae]